ncbi:hypothetical protein C7H19_01945 [Aphanothece hegewaldii CCALA 016]|uniref:Response regulatory domain-containing protein n=1 Tax=Aphanothece hegewaldii CCALA 016 TaxID=2107694 RepID=A0A2T1M415_9CHRO|nr:response regulator [Aphanothece hegewaldii]PSF39575.1 hypothetical protein C7H19_01945 [Aphanothece hegewaldii CCALA 016]
MKILIIEDDLRIAKPIAEDLKHQNHAVDLAVDGFDGLNYAQCIQYDLILLDLMLPKLDGISLCKKLRSENCQSFILLTTKDTTTDQVNCVDEMI